MMDIGVSSSFPNIKRQLNLTSQTHGLILLVSSRVCCKFSAADMKYLACTNMCTVQRCPLFAPLTHFTLQPSVLCFRRTFDLLQISHSSVAFQALVRQQLRVWPARTKLHSPPSSLPPSQGRTLFRIAPRRTQRHRQLQKLGQLMSADRYRVYIW